jgi:hypothetical protein
MKSIGKIGVFLFLQLFIFPVIALLIQQLLGFTPMRLTSWYGVIIALTGPYFFTYSKWANDNIWNTKTSKPTNTSYSSSEEVVEPIDESIDNNQNILGNINLPSLSNPVENNNDVLQKIEELKRQIESLESTLKTNDSSLEEINNLKSDEKQEDLDPALLIIIILVCGVILASFLYTISNGLY